MSDMAHQEERKLPSRGSNWQGVKDRCKAKVMWSNTSQGPRGPTKLRSQDIATATTRQHGEEAERWWRRRRRRDIECELSRG